MGGEGRGFLKSPTTPMGLEVWGSYLSLAGQSQATALVELSIPREGEHFTVPLGQTEPCPVLSPCGHEALWGRDPTERV